MKIDFETARENLIEEARKYHHEHGGDFIDCVSEAYEGIRTYTEDNKISKNRLVWDACNQFLGREAELLMLKDNLAYEAAQAIVFKQNPRTVTRYVRGL